MIAALVTSLLAGCSSSEQYGAGVNKQVGSVAIKAILIDPGYNGRLVNIKGRVSTQCSSSGCWLFLDDGTGQVLVNMSPKGFSVPPRYGKEAVVTGLVRQSLEGVMLIADGVEIL
ncbi:MAG: hypothetical protein ACOY3Z_08810 [Thermodesulfobacteriota bacterium]